MSCMCQNFRLFHVSNLSVRNFLIFSAHVHGVTDSHSPGTVASVVVVVGKLGEMPSVVVSAKVGKLPRPVVEATVVVVEATVGG